MPLGQCPPPTAAGGQHDGRACAATGAGANQRALLAADERADGHATRRRRADFNRILLLRRPARSRDAPGIDAVPLAASAQDQRVNRIAMYERPFTLPARRTAVTLSHLAPCGNHDSLSRQRRETRARARLLDATRVRRNRRVQNDGQRCASGDIHFARRRPLENASFRSSCRHERWRRKHGGQNECHDLWNSHIVSPFDRLAESLSSREHQACQDKVSCLKTEWQASLVFAFRFSLPPFRFSLFVFRYRTTVPLSTEPPRSSTSSACTMNL